MKDTETHAVTAAVAVAVTVAFAAAGATVTPKQQRLVTAARRANGRDTSMTVLHVLCCCCAGLLCWPVDLIVHL